MKTMDRDRILLSHLANYGVLSTRQLSSLVFKSIRLTTALRRLRILEKRTLIRKTKGLENGGYAWSLTTEGASLLGTKVPQKFINRNTLEHDVTLNDVRLALRTVGLGTTWQPEHALRRLAWADRSRQQNGRSIVPDGLFAADWQTGPKTIAVELELNQKSMNRYDEIFKRYEFSKALGVLWYIVPTHSIGKSIMARFQKRAKYTSCDFAYSVLHQVLENPWHMEWNHIKGKTLIRNCIKMTEPKVTGPAQEAAHGVITQEIEKAKIENSQIAESKTESCVPTTAGGNPPAVDPSPPTIKGERGQQREGEEGEVGMHDKKEGGIEGSENIENGKEKNKNEGGGKNEIAA